MNVDLTKIPPTMREIPHWLVWRIETDKKGRPTKVPYIAGSRRHASSIDPDTWTSLEEAIAGAAGADGIGFAIQDSGVVFIDLDHCIANGEIATWAKQIVDELASFTEVSPSGTGLHIYTAGNLPSGPRVKELDDGARVEFYDAGRYTTVSTVHLKDTPDDIVACPRLAEIYERVIARAPRAPSVPTPQAIDERRAHAVSSTIDAQNWMRRFGIEVLNSGPYGDGTKYVIACPGSHGDYDPRDGKAFIIQFASGGLSAGCMHSSCSLSNQGGSNRWTDLRSMFEPRVRLDAAGNYTPHSRTAPAPAPRPVLVENLDADPAPDPRPVAPPKEAVPYPQFPLWVAEGTSIGEGLVKPECAANSKFEQFLFMAALTFQMNYLALKVRFEHAPCNMTLFLGMISPPDTLKSACVNLAADYMFQANAGLSFRKALKAEDVRDRSILFASPGSPEGVLLRMSEIEAARAVMVYDELKHLVAKAKIESSSMESTLLAMYESGNLGASVKREKENFAFNAGRYSFSLIWCTTSDDFLKLWARLAGDSDGLNSRMFFLPAPEQPKKLTTYREVDHRDAAKTTEDYLALGIRRRVFKVENLGLWDEARETKRMSNRSVNLAEKFALALAVDLGRVLVDEDCQRRGLALASYRDEAAKWLDPFQAENPQADLEERIRRTLTKHGGIMRLRELERDLHSNRYGVFSWWRALNGMAGHGLIGFDPETARPRCVWLGTQEDD
jgi:hypothetical protein